MRKRVKIGDIIEIPTSKGLAYVQYTHKHTTPPVFGELVRVLPGFFATRPSKTELEELVKKPHRFSTFFPLNVATHRGIFEIVDNFPIPEFAKAFPIFKSTPALPNSDPKEAIWFLWDGKESWKVGKLTLEEQRKYPERAIYNDTGLIHAIETGKTGKRDLC